MKEQSLIKVDDIQSRIFTFRGNQVMIDRDLAELYFVQTKRLNEQVKRNINRFPKEFCFQLNLDEKNELVANCDRFKVLKHSSSLPYAFTEQGVAMLSAVLKSETAVDISLKIMSAFVEMRKFIASNIQIFARLDSIEHKQLSYKIESDQKFEQIFNALQENSNEVKQGIFFNGQFYDAYSFIIQLFQKAKKDLIIIDNYVDNTILDMLTKKNNNVTVTIVTQPNTKLFATDIQRFNLQYPSLTLKHSTLFHDRFVIIDSNELYHIGASLKDLGKKCFAFSLIEDKSLLTNLLNNL